MNSWPRLSVMFAAVVITAASVVFLKSLLPGNSAPPAQIPGASNSPVVERPRQVRRQPTILQAKPAIPAGGTRALSAPSYPEWVPADRTGLPTTEMDRPYLDTYAGPPPPNPRLLDRQTPSLDDPYWQHRPASELETGANQTPYSSEPAAHWPPANATVEPAAPTTRGYLTREEDSLWTISEDLYGTGAFYVALYLHNRPRIPEPARLKPSVALETPSAAELRRLYPDHCPAP